MLLQLRSLATRIDPGGSRSSRLGQSIVIVVERLRQLQMITL